MDLFLDPDARLGKSDALYDQLRDAIVSGRLRTGDRLPTSRRLADELGVARNTVTIAYGRLVAEGFVTGRSGAGSFVSFAGANRAPTRHPSALAPADRALRPASEWSQAGFDDAAPAVDLRTGRPDPALFPLRVWRRAIANAYNAAPPAYGDPAGLPALRRAIAQWTGRSRGVECEPDQVIVTAGAQQGIDLLTRLLLRPGDVVAVEDPGYPPVASLLASSGLVVAPVPVDREGIMVADVPDDACLVYVTPSHQSPTGVVMSMRRRRALLELATDRGLAIIEDDYDTEYRHGNRPLEPLYRLDQTGRVLYVGTFSKTLSPSLRLGFVVLPPSLVNGAVALRSVMDWQPPAAAQHALFSFIVDGHLDRHLRRTRVIYTERQHALDTWLRRQQQSGLIDEIYPSEAGLHLTALLGAGLTEPVVRGVAERHGVALGNFGQCWRRADAADGIVIGFGATATGPMIQALDTIAAGVVAEAR